MKILIMNPFGIGDVVFSFWMIEAIRKMSPSHEIHYLCNERTRELVALNPSIGKTHVFNRDQFRNTLRRNPMHFMWSVLNWFGRLKRERYDVCFDLSMGRDYAFVLKLLGVRRRIGFDYRGRGRFLTDKVPLEGFEGKAIREHYLGLLRLWSAGVPEGAYPVMNWDPLVSIAAHRWRVSRNMNADQRIAIISPAGGRSWGKNAHYKQWSPERFALVMRHLSEKHQLAVILMGDADEKELLDRILFLSGISEGYVMAGENLSTVLDLMRRAALFAGNDGGLSHIADLANLPRVVLFGPVDEVSYGPVARDNAWVVTEPVACRPCYRSFQFPACHNEKQCLEKIPAERVNIACDKLLEPMELAKNGMRFTTHDI